MFASTGPAVIDEPAIGSIVHCDLYGFEHSGVYIGNGEIVELCRDGTIQVTNPRGFSSCGRDSRVLVACQQRFPLGSREIANRAIEKIGSRREYNVLIDNCHQFASGCVTGNFENSDNPFWMLADTIKRVMNSGEDINWREWKLSAKLRAAAPWYCTRSRPYHLEPGAERAIFAHELAEPTPLSKGQVKQRRTVHAPRSAAGIVELDLLYWMCNVGDTVSEHQALARVYCRDSGMIEVYAHMAGQIVQIIEQERFVSGEPMFYLLPTAVG